MEWRGGEGVGEESEPFSSLSPCLNKTGNILVIDIHTYAVNYIGFLSDRGWRRLFN